MATPLVSVVIPTYNQPDLLAVALDSVLAQTLRDREVIVINDGCTDDTLDRLQKYGDAIRVISQPNGGIGAARNRGIDEARGKYVAPLDHDDYWMSEKLQVQAEFLEANPQCIAATCPYAASTAPQVSIFDPAAAAGPDHILRRPLLQFAHGITVMGTSALMFDRQRAEDLRYGVQRNAVEDVQFHIGLIAAGPVGVAGDKILAVWRVHAQNSSRKLADYTRQGILLLRRMEARGEFGDLAPQDQSDLRTYLAHLGRVACMGMLLQGRRANGMGLYLREARRQLREGRINFLAMYPAMALLPTALVRRKVGRWTNGD